MDKPSQIQEPDLTKLRRECQMYVDAVNGGAASDEQLCDYKQYIFEEAVCAVFGKGVFDWVRERTR